MHRNLTYVKVSTIILWYNFQITFCCFTLLLISTFEKCFNNVISCEHIFNDKYNCHKEKILIRYLTRLFRGAVVIFVCPIFFYTIMQDSLVAQLVKNPPAMQADPSSIPGSGRPPWRSDRLATPVFLGFLVAQTVESTCSVRDLVQSVGWKDPLEEGMATHSSILAWRIPMDRGARATVRGVTKSRTSLSN